MSTVDEMITQLAAGRDAIAKVPNLEARIRDLEHTNENYRTSVQRLEENIIGYKREIEAKSSTIRSLEVERDDAGFRELEAQDRLTTLLRALETVSGSLAGAVASATPKPVEDVSVAQPQAGEASASTPQEAPAAGQSASHPPQAVSEAQPQPIAPSGSTEGGDGAQTATVPSISPSTHSGETSSVQPEPSAGPYVGKKYWNHPSYVSLANWLEGGGTEESYRWRPSYMA